MEQTSQKADHPPAQTIHHEWRTAENSAVFVLAKLQSMKETNPHLAPLDVGAGSGTISVTFAKAIPDGNVTAIDLKSDILPRARANAEMAGIKNIEFQQGDAYRLPFADGTFHIAFCHQMLTHLEAPWDALHEMIRVTEIGGIVAGREGDLETECVWPESSGLLKWHKFAASMTKVAGGTSTGGRQLLSWALKAGMERDQITVGYSTWSYSTPSELKVWADGMVNMIRGGRIREGGLKSELVTENDLEEMARAWGDWVEKEDATCAMIQGEILIQR